MLNGEVFKKNIDFVLLGAALLIVVVGIVAIYSATHNEDNDLKGIYKKQILWAVLGLGAMAFSVAIPNKFFYAFAYVIFGISVILLILLFLWGASVANATRWFSLGPLKFQPSELAKIGLVIALARYLSLKDWSLEKPSRLIVPLVMTLIPMALIAKQPDLGTALVFGAIFFSMLYWAGARFIYLFAILSPLLSCTFALYGEEIGSALWWGLFFVVLIGAIWFWRPRPWITALLLMLNVGVGAATPYIWERLHDYQRQRILAFINPAMDPLGARYQVSQSKVAIGSGGMWGKGFLNGTQTNFGFLPLGHTDSIFSVIGEEHGFLGSIVLLTLLYLIAWRAIKIASSVKNKFSGLLAIGLASILVFHVFVNVGMTLDLMPVTGLPLPFLSYGGSSLLTNMILVGLLLNVSVRRHEY